MNRKAGTAADALVDFISYGIFILVLLVFYALFRFTADTSTNNIQNHDFPQIETQQILLQYLKTPLDINGEKISVAEYLATAALDKSISETGEAGRHLRLEKYSALQKPLDSFAATARACYRFTAYFRGSDIFEFPLPDSSCPPFTSNAHMSIPVFDESILVNIQTSYREVKQ